LLAYKLNDTFASSTSMANSDVITYHIVSNVGDELLSVLEEAELQLQLELKRLLKY